MGCIRFNTVTMVRDTQRVTNHLFNMNEQFAFQEKITRTEACGCANSTLQVKVYYVIICDGRTYEVSAADVREVDCVTTPPEQIGIPMEDVLSRISEPNAGFTRVPERRHDALWAEEWGKVVFDLRDK
jgi:hypothetical protein